MFLDLTIVVLTFNEELNIAECLQSLRSLECEVFVVDSGSSDRTTEIAEQHGTSVVDHAFENYGTQRNWAQTSLPIRTEWVLHVDADERLTPELQQSIQGALTDPPDDVDGFLLRRRTVFMGRWIRHGGHYPSYHARLFRKHKGRCEDRLYDQHYIVQGKVEKLPGDMIDNTPDLTAWTLSHARWAGMEAREQMEGDDQSGRLIGKPFGTPIEKRRWLRQRVYNRVPLFIRPFLYFGYRYVLRLGFLDGRAGLVFHFLQGCWYRFQVDALILESKIRARSGTNSRALEEAAKPAKRGNQ
jgi:glycosyltransferase involved in cell wall biosynthesis